MKKRLLSIIKWLGVAAFWLALWQVAHELINNDLFLPSPLKTVQVLLKLAVQAQTWKTVGATLLRIFGGFLAGMLVGTLLGAVTAASKLLRDLFRPLMTIIKSTPVASFIILALVLIPTGIVPSFTAMLMVIPVFWSNVYTGALSADRLLLEMADVFNMSRKRRLLDIHIPTTVPFFRSAFSSGIGLAWKAGVAAEVICVTGNSIGKQLYESKIYFETESLFAWTVLVIALSLTVENIAMALVNKAMGGNADDKA